MTDIKKEILSWYKKYISSNEIYYNYLESDEKFSSSLLRDTRPLLLEYNTVFNYERKGNNREGALTQKDLKQKVAGIHLLVKTIKIRKDIEFPLQIHTYFHELAHLVLDHNDQERNEVKLTTGQKEYVAETTAQALLHSFCGGMSVSDLPSNNKWDQSKYIEGWVNQSQISKDKSTEMKRQVEWAFEKISKCILVKKGILIEE